MPDLHRRGFLRGLAGSVLGSVGARWAGGGALLLAAGAREASGAGPFVTPLRRPPVLTGSHVTLVAREALVQLVPGPPTRMWTFNGTFPGPVIRRPSGTPTRVTVQHRLPAKVGTLTIHHHGAHAVPGEDGQPERNVIRPGGQRTYTYGLREDGAPERAAYQWYHDHSHYRTTRNVWHGLAGLFILDDAVDARLPLPKGEFDVPLMLTERTLDASNQLTDPFVDYATADAAGQLSVPPKGYAPFDDLFGTRFLTNGVESPFLDVAPRKYRFRILNTSPFAPYNLRLSDGSAMTQIATESGLMPKPLVRKEILIGPAERVEVVVDFRGKEGRALTLDSVLPSSSRVSATSPRVASFLQFRVTKRGKETSRVPATLRPLPAWVAKAAQQPHRVWAFGVGVDTQGRGAWTINGRAFDHMRVDAHPELGSVETWLLVNTTTTSHYIHIHDVDWKLLSRNGAAPEPGEDALKETFRLDPGEVLLVAGKLSDHLGHYMLHCHMLQHEDHGMMTTFEVVKPGQGDAAEVPGLEAALARSIASPEVRAQVRRVVGAAKGGRPAPASALPSSNAQAVASLRQLLGGREFQCLPEA